MKKYALLLALSLALLIGCAQTSVSDSTSSQAGSPVPTIFTFSGESNDIALTNGRLSLNTSTSCNEKETLDTGSLTIKNKPLFQNVTAITATLYLAEKNSRHVLSVVQRSNTNGETIPIDHIEGPLGSSCGSTSLLGTTLLKSETLSEQLFFELTATRSDNTTTTYTLPLKITKVS